MKTLSIIDSHTGGEPTRLVLSGGPDLGSGPLAERVARWRQDFDHYRSAIVCEPRGNDVLVGALLCEPHAPGCSAGVIYFNNAGYLGMCGHGTIGLVVSLAHIGKIQAGRHRIDTPVGVVEVELHPDNSVTVHNIPVWRKAKAVQVEVPGIGSVTGDIAWGGNWFFLIGGHGLDLDIGNIDQLTDYSWRVRQALHAAGITGDDGAEIDHIELYADAKDPKQADCQNFVLCPGRAYDRSPCGTGTSAKLACLAADGKLAVGASWRQQSITGSLFYGSYRPHQDAGKILPSIRGTAHVTLAGELLLDETDPLLWGIR